MKALKRRLKGIFGLGVFSAIGIAMTWSIALGQSTPDVSGPPSDTLQVGTQTSTIFEGSEPASVTLIAPISTSVEYVGLLGVTNTQVIALLEPGTSQISDLVTATLSAPLDGTPVSGPTFGVVALSLSVTLRSDGESPLTGSFNQSITETGLAQDLTTNFNTLFFGLVGSEVVLPTIRVTSDLERVPEPASLAIFATGLAGLGLLRRRRRKNV